MFMLVFALALCIAYLCFVMLLHRGRSLLFRHKVCQKSRVSVSVVMCHRSVTESSLAAWLEMMKTQSVQVPVLTGDDDKWQVGKKEALRRVMSSVETPYALLTDADTKVGSLWVERVSGLAAGHDLLLLPVRMTVDNNATGLQALWQRLQALEFASLVGSGMAFCGLGRPILCNGAGMAADTEKWLQSYQDLHPEIPSGDDVFLLHSFKRRGLDIAYSTDEDTVVSTQPNKSFGDFWRQRTRWTSKAYAYTDRDTLAVGGFVAAVNLCALVLLLRPALFALFWVVKSLADYSFLRRLRLLYSSGYTLPLCMMTNLVYPFYAVITPLAGLIGRSRKW